MADKDTFNEHEFLVEARTRYETACQADADEWDEAYDDMLFSDGHQWPEAVKNEREAQDRPCLTINQIPKFIDRVIGDLRENRPAIKYKPIDGDADPKKADFLEGLARSIESQSNGLDAYTTSFEHAVDCGRGFFRITTDYADDNTFDQDIMIRRIEDPLSVRWDPGAREYTLSDARYMFIVTRIQRDKYEQMYPGKLVSDFDTDENIKSEYWLVDDDVRVAEYFVKTPDKKITIYLLGDGTVTDELPKDVEAVRTRTVQTYRVERYLISGAHILEGPDRWAGQYIPIIPVWGKEKWYNGHRHTRGITRFAKDPQRMYNYWRTSETEAVALAPKEPYLLTIQMIAGHETMWNNLGRASSKYMLYNPDPNAPQGKPSREQPAPYYSGYQTNAQISARELMDTTGMPEASLGESSNERSGEAIKQRRATADRMNYTYTDNLMRSIRYAGKILIDLIPHIYDSERIVRILGPDQSERYVSINSPVDIKTGEPLEDDALINMKHIGKYDVVASAGPSNITKRLEAADWISQLMERYPESAPVLSPMFVQLMDLPKGDDVVELLKAMAPPEIQAIMERQSGGGIQDNAAVQGMPPDAMMAEQGMSGIPEEPPVDPLTELQVAQEQAKLRKIEAEADKAEAEANKVMLEVNAMADNAGVPTR